MKSRKFLFGKTWESLVAVATIFSIISVSGIKIPQYWIVVIVLLGIIILIYYWYLAQEVSLKIRQVKVFFKRLEKDIKFIKRKVSHLDGKE